MAGLTSETQNLDACSRPVPSRPAGKPLELFWVGDGDVYGARTPEEAFELHISIWGEELRLQMTIADVSLVDEISLDSPNRGVGRSGQAPTLRQIRTELINPGPIELD
ncbi:hypothetical protein V4Z64_005013 [Pseudomonas aeruginosa]|uniref:hypothetical protein n=1 Tax=Pseudomonas aeruginosa TaxID=287 RepID=UPI0015F0E7D5|nr:hypothetical protein [Pseudomonas aeruginosa]MBA5106063.1 hypothetical protein [Pseudomonas aeruginosa]MDP5989998.1 hypothetical protein [Pseudomonas aeruginosa]HCE9175716.1 hypothetical protein [Pseudomonas aeruginosa]HEJ9771297.1 hypothetical protein [Pseudomonas aeruginosa]HEO1611753.1 hypothetical protein [Pseudomonas aeruginosa]